jgi:cell wall-associated NlpC family hydrolase
VHGSNLAHYAQLGGPTGLLGFPTTDETATPDTMGRYNHFTGGSMYWTPTLGSHEVHGFIRDKWAAMGWERSLLGYPSSDEFAVTGGRQSNFQHGLITWTAAKGAVPTTRGDDIVRMTRTHLGAPYVFGAAGPSTFDCSGLVQYVHRQVGISVPRTSESQAAAARPVAKAAAQPGDLIFLLNNSHVGVYVGGGQMIDAPKTGDVVRQRAIWTSVYTVGRYW